MKWQLHNVTLISACQCASERDEKFYLEELDSVLPTAHSYMSRPLPPGPPLHNEHDHHHHLYHHHRHHNQQHYHHLIGARLPAFADHAGMAIAHHAGIDPNFFAPGRFAYANPSMLMVITTAALPPSRQVGLSRTGGAGSADPGACGWCEGQPCRAASSPQ